MLKIPDKVYTRFIYKCMTNELNYGYYKQYKVYTKNDIIYVKAVFGIEIERWKLGDEDWECIDGNVKNTTQRLS